MASTITTAVAARIPNHEADQLREQAEDSGLTMSDVVSVCIRVALERGELDQLLGQHR